MTDPCLLTHSLLRQVIGDQPPWVSVLVKVTTVVATCSLNIVGVGASKGPPEPTEPTESTGPAGTARCQ